jgi:DNA-binding transcriptional MerR regulator
MSPSVDRRFTIGEVSEITDVPVHLLRQWEDKFPQLKPKRTRSNRRYYLAKDIEIVKRIKTLLRHDRLRVDGARIRLAQELHGEGRPRTQAEAIDLADKIQSEARAMLDLLDSLK